MEVYQDARVYDTGMVCVIEIMGRHAGWLAGAAAPKVKPAGGSGALWYLLFRALAPDCGYGGGAWFCRLQYQLAG